MSPTVALALLPARSATVTVRLLAAPSSVMGASTGIVSIPEGASNAVQWMVIVGVALVPAVVAVGLCRRGAGHGRILRVDERRSSRVVEFPATSNGTRRLVYRHFAFLGEE